MSVDEAGASQDNLVEAALNGTVFYAASVRMSGETIVVDLIDGICGA